MTVAALVTSSLWLRPLVERQASSALGRPVEIGQLMLRLGSPLVITAERVVVGNPPGFPVEEGAFLHAERLAIHLDAWDSLRRWELIVPLIEMERPTSRLISAHGSSNVGGTDGESLFSDTDRLKIGAIRVRDGRVRVSWADLGADFEFAISAKSKPGPDQDSVTAQGHGTYAGQPIEATLTTGTLAQGREALGSWPFELNLTNGPTRAAVRGAIKGPLKPSAAGLDLTIAGPDIALPAGH